ncbi:MAG: glycoside hydrolase family 104 protein [Burkholderiales bacterium]|nr:glycoside hydrolase family 104 protein [Burkholderiales bacterium]
MNRVAVALAAFVALAAGLFMRRAEASAASSSTPWPSIDMTLLPPERAAGDAGQGGFLSQALGAMMPLPEPNAVQAERNIAAFLVMIRAAEGTAKDGGYGALFGWPMAGRQFDPLTVDGHPRQFFDYTDKAGKKIRTSAAGAYQITWTTWAGYLVAFKAWAAVNGRVSSGFLPATQDSFAVFLLSIDGALDHVRAGRLPEALAIARRRWASLPGAGYNQPERSESFVIAAYKNAGGAVA